MKPILRCITIAIASVVIAATMPLSLGVADDNVGASQALDSLPVTGDSLPLVDHNGVNAIAILVIAAFVTERVTNGLLFLFSCFPAWTQYFPDPQTLTDVAQRTQARKKQKVLYFLLAGTFAGVVIAYIGEVRIFQFMGFMMEWNAKKLAEGQAVVGNEVGDSQFKVNVILDCILTGVIMSAGGDHMAAFLRSSGASGTDQSDPQPVEIIGRLEMDNTPTTESD